ncbi:hypothetical protein HY312_03535 [Candidatus Saccharibacteria bacterium]|nr:hypothetical protein [Candidatus Saccharibacteria bacterium]
MERHEQINITTETTELDYSQEAAHVQQMALSYLESWKLRLQENQSQELHATYTSLPDAAGRTRAIALSVDVDGVCTVQLGRYDVEPRHIYTGSYTIDRDGSLVTSQEEANREVSTDTDPAQEYFTWSNLHVALFDCDTLARRNHE